jgi:hypothetical protein
MEYNIITYVNDKATDIDHFSSREDARTALALVGGHLGSFTGATVDDDRIIYWDDYSGCKTVLEVTRG